MTKDAMRAMHQQFTTALEGLTRQNVELQNDLRQSRQQPANELAALRQEVRWSPLRGWQVTRDCRGSLASSRGLKTRDETGALCSRVTLVQRYHVCRS